MRAGISDKSSEMLSAENPKLLSSLKMVRTKLQMSPQLIGIYHSIIVLKILNLFESINKQIFYDFFFKAKVLRKISSNKPADKWRRF